MKFIRITTLIILTAFVSVCIYANTRYLSPSQTLEPVNLAAFSIGKINAENERTLQTKVSQLKGVTACKINAEGRVVSVIYQPSVTSEKKIQEVLSNSNQLEVTTKKFESEGGGCPVHQISGSMSALISSLDLRMVRSFTAPIKKQKQ